MRFHKSAGDSAEEGGGLVSGQQFIEINLLGRFSEWRLRIACNDTLIVEVEGAVDSYGDLLKLHGCKLLKIRTSSQRKKKTREVSFLTYTINASHNIASI